MRPTQRLRVLLGGLFLAVAMSAPASAAYFRTVIIDPGHGGHDMGGRAGQVYEKHLALDTAARLEIFLKSKGIRTVMTRRSDTFISLPGRVAMANRIDQAIFVSVHYNFTTKRDVSGLETFYNTPKSRQLAAFVNEGITRGVRANNRGVKFARFYVIRNTKCPAILVECGFVSNQTERDRMKQSWFRQSLAEGVGNGILRYRREG
jgi:N-acetylmuramoyl-L-alanine amidase